VSNSCNPIYNDNYHVPLANTNIQELVAKGSSWLVFELFIEDAGDDVFLGQFRIPLKTLIDQNEHPFPKALLADQEGAIIDEIVFIDVQVTLI